MARIDIRVDGLVGATPIRIGAQDMRIQCGEDVLNIHGNCAAFRRFFETCLMCVPFPLIGRVRGEDGTEVILDEEVGR